MAEQFDLVCTWAVGDFTPQDTTLRVNTDTNTVNGHPATISDAEIRLPGVGESGRPTLIVINRYTGSMNLSVKDARGYDVSGRGKCIKPTQRQF